METKTKFTPGMLVALCETWPTKRIICLMKVKTVGKQQVRVDSSSRFDLNGQAMGKGVYRWRAIKPVTKQVLAAAEAQGVNTSMALGCVVPDETPAEPKRFDPYSLPHDAADGVPDGS